MASKSLFRGLSTNAREEQNTRYSNFEEDMRAVGRNLSPPKLNAQKKRIWDVRPGVRNDNNDMNDFFVKNDISWIKVSKPWDNPFAERGIRTIKHEYLNQVWIGNLSEFEKLYWVEQNRQYVNGHYK